MSGVLAPRTTLRLPGRATRQRFLCCLVCGSAESAAGAGLCRRCYRRIYYSDTCFGGQRERVLARDQRRCQSCGAGNWLNVHHRRPGVDDPDWLLTLCAACHARIHRLQILRFWLPEEVLRLWEELHPALPQQLQFSFREAR